MNDIFTIVVPFVVLAVGLFTWARGIYERADAKREKLNETIEGLTLENVTLKGENAELKRMNAEWRDLANRYHALAVKYYNITRDMLIEREKQAPSLDGVSISTTVSIPSPDDVFNDRNLGEELLG